MHVYVVLNRAASVKRPQFSQIPGGTTVHEHQTIIELYRTQNSELRILFNIDSNTRKELYIYFKLHSLFRI